MADHRACMNDMRFGDPFSQFVRLTFCVRLGTVFSNSAVADSVPAAAAELRFGRQSGSKEQAGAVLDDPVDPVGKQSGKQAHCICICVGACKEAAGNSLNPCWNAQASSMNMNNAAMATFILRNKMALDRFCRRRCPRRPSVRPVVVVVVVGALSVCPVRPVVSSRRRRRRPLSVYLSVCPSVCPAVRPIVVIRPLSF